MSQDECFVQGTAGLNRTELVCTAGSTRLGMCSTSSSTPESGKLDAHDMTSKVETKTQKTTKKAGDALLGGWAIKHQKNTKTPSSKQFSLHKRFNFIRDRD